MLATGFTFYLQEAGCLECAPAVGRMCILLRRWRASTTPPTTAPASSALAVPGARQLQGQPGQHVLQHLLQVDQVLEQVERLNGFLSSGRILGQRATDMEWGQGPWHQNLSRTHRDRSREGYKNYDYIKYSSHDKYNSEIKKYPVQFACVSECCNY